MCVCVCVCVCVCACDIQEACDERSNFKMIKTHNFSCLSTTTCQGIHHDLEKGACYLLYDTTVTLGRLELNRTTITADKVNKLLMKGKVNLFIY